MPLFGRDVPDRAIGFANRADSAEHQPLLSCRLARQSRAGEVQFGDVDIERLQPNSARRKGVGFYKIRACLEVPNVDIADQLGGKQVGEIVRLPGESLFTETRPVRAIPDQDAAL